MSSHKILTVCVIILNVRLYFTCWSILLSLTLVASGCLLLALMLVENLKLLHECIAARSLCQPVLWAAVQHTELCLKDLPSSSKSVFPSFFSSVSFSLFCLSPHLCSHADPPVHLTAQMANQTARLQQYYHTMYISVRVLAESGFK